MAKKKMTVPDFKKFKQEGRKFTYVTAYDYTTASIVYESETEVILVGVSRATKTPTCMYLASRGIKAANVPLVPGVPLPSWMPETWKFWG